MDIKQQRDQRKSLAVGMLVLIVITVLSLVLAILLFFQNNKLKNELIDNKQVIIRPMVNMEQDFSFYGDRGDARYLRSMALSFVALRVNVSSQTVENSHEILVSYASEEFRPKLIEALSKEKKVLSVDNGASTFYVKNIQVSPSNGIVDVKGELKFYYGIKSINPINKHYRLRIDTRNSKVELSDFVELQE